MSSSFSSLFSSLFSSSFSSSSCGARGLALAVSLVAAGGCGFFSEPELAAPPQVAAKPAVLDDARLEALIPAGLETVIDIDVRAMRASPWTAALLETSPAQRETKLAALGYDDAVDVDRMIFGVASQDAGAPTLVVARGRFDPTRVTDAYRDRWPGAMMDRWRGVAIASNGKDAIAVPSARTFVSGPTAAVLRVVDRAFGDGPDLAADPALGPVRRAIVPEAVAGTTRTPAVSAAVTVSERLRAQAAPVFRLPPALRQLALRVDLDEPQLDVRALALLDDPGAAALFARRLDALARDPGARLALAALGLDDLASRARVTVDGARVRLETAISADHRPETVAALRAWLHPDVLTAP